MFPHVEKATQDPFVSSVFPSISVNNLEKAVQWYCEKLHFKVLAFNPHFVTMEIAPGRICFINTNQDKVGSSNIGLHVPDAENLHQHLVNQGVDVDALQEGVAKTKHFDFRDKDGNNFGVWSGMFGMNEIEYVHKPGIERYNRYTLSFVPEIHAIGYKVTVDITNPNDTLKKAIKELKMLLHGLPGTETNLFFVNPIIDKYAGITEHSLYICNEKKEPLKIPHGLFEITIPAQYYAVFSYDRQRIDFRTDYTNKYRWLGKQFGFLKAELGRPNAFHLEYEHDDCIEVYIPFHMGPDEQHNYE